MLKAAAVRDDDGAIEAAVTIIEDVTASRRATLRVEFLARIGQLLGSSLDYQQTLRNVAGLAVPQLADWCAVDLFDAEGEREPVAIAHSEPAKLRTAERLRAYEPQRLDPDQGLGRVWRTGESLLYTQIPDELLVAAAVDSEHLALLREVGMRAVLIVPLSIGSRTIGALTMVSSDSGRSFDDGDVEFAEQIAARAALAVESARLYSERSEVARTLQNSLLPEAIPQIPGWEIAALYRPAGHESEVGGDFYDFWEVDGDWLMMIGDVTGKGVGAAALTSLVRHTARAASEFDARPAQIARARGRSAQTSSRGLAVHGAVRAPVARRRGAGRRRPSAAAALERRRCRGGRRARHVARRVRCGLTGRKRRSRSSRVETLVAFTDGVTDAVGAGGERWGTERLRASLAAAPNGEPSSLRARLAQALDEFQVGAQADDTALVIMRFCDTDVSEQRSAQRGSVDDDRIG